MSKKVVPPKSGSDFQAWKDLAFDEKNPNQLEKLNKDQLSVYVTHHNLPNGTKSSPKMMIVYIKMHLAGQCPGIQALFPGEKFEEFKIARIKKELSKCGILPEGTFAELSMKLLEQDKFKNALKQKSGGGGNSGENTQNENNDGQSKTVIDGVVIAKEILKLGEAGNYEAILSLMGTKITRDSTVGQMRKAYLKLSLIIHPDKLQHYPDAKKSFQELVDAYERLSKPEDFEKKNASNNTKNKTTLKRSNQGCCVTKVLCPRCKIEWNTPMDGNPEFAYTIFMTGLKNYHCSTCLLDFGCISALHKCPHCRKGFEYHPDDFHRKVKCGNDKCNFEFGFYEHYIQDRTMKEIREQIMTDLEQRMKRLEAKKRRAKSQSRRNQQSSEELKQQEEQAYLIGLNDLCPRCGIDLHELPEDVDQFRHLRECTDEYKIKEYQKKKETQKKEENLKQQIKDKQDNIQNEAVFNAFGGESTMLWVLTEDQLKKQCQISKVDDTGSKEEMIARLAQVRKGQKALGSEEVKVPKNLSGMSNEQIRGVMFAHGLNPDKYRSKKDMINAIERIQIGLDKAPQPKMLQDDPNKKMEQENNKDSQSEDSDNENEDGSDYELPSDNEKQKKQFSENINKLRNLKYNEKQQEEEEPKKKKKLVRLKKKNNVIIDSD